MFQPTTKKDDSMQYLTDNLEQIVDYFYVVNKSKIIYVSEKLNLIGSQIKNIDAIQADATVKIGNRHFKVDKRNFTSDELDCEIYILHDAGDNVDYLEILQSISANMAEGLIVSDKNGKILIYNRALEEQENKKSGEMVGRFLWEAYGYHDKAASEHLKVLKNNSPVINNYEAHSVVDNEPHYVVYSTYPVFRNGEPLGVFSICRNESDLKNQLEETIESKRQYTTENIQLVNKHYKNGTSYTFSDIVGTSEAMKKLIKQAQSISWLDNSILIAGETGTGKEVLAQSIHNFGKRSSQPFIGINCSAIPETLIESILFGSVKGAFTDAQNHPGIFEEVGQGTLFLDEMNSMTGAMQVKLLRVVQEKRYRRVGGQKDFDLECRIISGVNETPEMLLNSGTLREDLFYRLAGFQLMLPPLRDRAGDLELLIENFIRKYSVRLDKRVKNMEQELKLVLLNYSWPGNIRELENAIENLIIMTPPEDAVIGLSHLPDYLKAKFGLKDRELNVGSSTGESVNLGSMVQSLESQIISKKFNECGKNISKCAKELGISRQSLTYKLKKHQII